MRHYALLCCFDAIRHDYYCAMMSACCFSYDATLLLRCYAACPSIAYFDAAVADGATS